MSKRSAIRSIAASADKPRTVTSRFRERVVTFYTKGVRGMSMTSRVARRGVVAVALVVA